MWLSQKANSEKKEEGNGFVAVATNKGKGSQHALRWAVDHIVSRGQTVVLVHVKIKAPQSLPNTPMGSIRGGPATSFDNVLGLQKSQIDPQTKELFLPFRFYCTRKDVQCRNVVLENTDVAKALIDYVTYSGISTLVVGVSAKHGFLMRLKHHDVSSTVSKGAPDFCSVYVINKGKVSSVRNATRPPPISPINSHLNLPSSTKSEPPPSTQLSHINSSISSEISAPVTPRSNDHTDAIKSPFNRVARRRNGSDFSFAETEASFGNSESPSADHAPSFFHMDSFDAGSDMPNFESLLSMKTPDRSYIDRSQTNENSLYSQESVASWTPQTVDDVEAEIRRLKLELKQTIDMYSTACREAITAKQKAKELHRWKMQEKHRIEEARMSEEHALAVAEKEKTKAKAALEAAEAQRRIAQLESQKRVHAEMQALREKQEKIMLFDTLAQTDVRYRRYTIDDIEQATELFSESLKIGEGGYGPVYKGYLDHTEVAIKILRPDAVHGMSQFQQEIEVLSSVRHPNMVLLLGACPEYGCLVYEYMAKGSLEDCLFPKENSPALSWQLRFRIAAEIGTGLLFLHQAKPEPLVHRDLKPGNILLDLNYVSKISDVGLARLVPPSVANSVTQYRMTSAAGTFCYIDPEYQQTGMLGVKSDIYSLGIMLLQLITSKHPMGLAHHVERAIENGTFEQMLDPEVPDWPVEDALGFAKLALRCAELRRKDRPDLCTEILPELNRLRSLAEDDMHHFVRGNSSGSSSSKRPPIRK